VAEDKQISRKLAEQSSKEITANPLDQWGPVGFEPYLTQIWVPPQYLSAVFEFSKHGTDYQPYYLIYNYKLDKFYPFVPIISRRNARNKKEEIKIMKAVKDERLPFEEDMEEWHPIWHLPF
jgi:hypothetical protein